MKITLPDNPEIEREINRVLAKLQEVAEDKTISELTTAGAEPVEGDELKPQLFNDDGTRKLVIRHQGRNYSVDLTEIT